MNTTQTAATVSDYPTTLREWQAHIGTLQGRALLNEAKAANQVRFVRVLEEEGFNPPEITGIFEAFAEQFVTAGVAAPGKISGYYIDFRYLIDELADDSIAE